VESVERVAIVTGGGTGLGRTIAQRLARAGWNLVLAGPAAQELQAVVHELRSGERQALAVVADVRYEDQVAAMARAALDAFGRIDALVNNAGIIGPTAPVAEMPRDEWDEVLAVNLTGAMLCAKAVVPAMRSRRSGKIINIASVAGKIAYALRSAYGVSKWGMIGLTMTLAKEMAVYNIQVNAVCPGPVRGERMARVIGERAAELGRSEQQVERDYVSATALKRLVEPEDVADLVAFLASEQSNNITGQAIDVSAGYGL
jgi:NAD(P)-dependent dehydrogenase (short-subunit alcohol dehydrogenase family)